MAVIPAFTDRKSTKVLVSKRRGNIFIQTDQPIYNPTRKGERKENNINSTEWTIMVCKTCLSFSILCLQVNYRIFTLDHTYRPSEDVIQISVIVSDTYLLKKLCIHYCNWWILWLILIISLQNAAGNKVMRSLRSAKGGILKGNFPIPDVSKYDETNEQ